MLRLIYRDCCFLQINRFFCLYQLLPKDCFQCDRTVNDITDGMGEVFLGMPKFLYFLPWGAVSLQGDFVCLFSEIISGKISSLAIIKSPNISYKISILIIQNSM